MTCLLESHAWYSGIFVVVMKWAFAEMVKAITEAWATDNDACEQHQAELTVGAPVGNDYRRGDS